MKKGRMQFLLILCCTLLVSAGAWGAVLNVPIPYATIQAAINAAAPGDQIVIAAGTYAEVIDINKANLTLTGAGVGSTIINITGMTGPNGAGVHTASNGVTIEHLTVFGLSVDNGARYGIKYSGVTGGTVQNVEVHGCRSTGIDMPGVSNIVINNVHVHDNGLINLPIGSGGGLGLRDISNSTISNVTTNNNPWGAIRIQTWNGTLSGVVISGTNTFGELTVGGIGIYLEQGNVNPLGPPFPITYGHTGSPDVLLLPADAAYAMYGDDDQAPRYQRIMLFPTLAQAVAAANIPNYSHLTTNKYIKKIDDGTFWVGAGMQIQPAITAAPSGGTVNVLAGTYPTGITAFSKNLTLQGTDPNNRPLITPTANTGSADDARGWFLVNTGYSVDFKKLRFDANGYQIFNVIRHKGPGHIDHCDFTNVFWSTYLGFGIASLGSNAFLVENCTFSNIERVGCHLNDPTTSPKVFRNNVFTGKGTGDNINYGVEVERGGRALIENNVITNCTGVAVSDGSTSAATLATTYFAASDSTRVTYHGNVFTNNTTAFYIGYSAPTDHTVAVITENKMENNATRGILSVSNRRVEGILNWWGSAGGPDPVLLLSQSGRPQPIDANGSIAVAERSLDDAVQGDVHYSPWIATNGNDFNGGLPGWQPDKSTLGVSTNGTIQEGIDNVVGSTVNIAAGTYVGQVKATGFANLNLVGAGVGATVIKAPATAMPFFFTTGSNNNKPVLFIDNSTVHVSGLTVDGDGKGNLNNRFQGIGFWNSGGSVSNVRVTGVRDTPFSGVQHGVSIYAFNNTGGPYTLSISDVQVDDMQKNAFALSGTGLTVDLDDVDVAGSGPTSVTAQNGIQISYGAGGTVDNCTVDGINYTGASWGASAVLLYNNANVSIGATACTNSENGVVEQDGSVSINGLTVTTNVADAWGAYAFNYTATASNVRVPQPMFEEDYRSERNLDNPVSFSISNSTLTGPGGTGNVGLAAYGDASTTSFTVNNCDVTGWESGVVVDATTGTITPASIINSYFANTYNAWDNSSGHTWNNNCYSDFASNSGFPLQYDVTGGGGNTDYNPSSDCSNIDMVMSSDYIGCVSTGNCPRDTLYLRFDQVDYYSGTVTITLPTGFAADWSGINPEVRPAVPLRTANLALSQALVTGSTIIVDFLWGPDPARSVNDNLFFAAIPLLNVSAGHGAVLNPVIAGYNFVDASGYHTTGFSITPAGSVVDCDAPTVTLGGGAGETGCNAYNTEAEFLNAVTVFVGVDAAPNSPLNNAYFMLNGTTQYDLFTSPIVGDYNGTWPTGGESPNVWATMIEGCNTLVLYGFDTECNAGTSTALTVVKDTQAPDLTVGNTSSFCYNNWAPSPQYGGNQLDDYLNITTAINPTTMPAGCFAATGTLAISYSGGAWNNLGALDFANYPSTDAEALTLWTWILTQVPGAANGENYTFDLRACDCAGNCATGSFTICIDLTAPANTLTEFDARPTDLGVWLKWAWNYDSTQAVLMEVWRSPDSFLYPGYTTNLWANLGSNANYPQSYPPAGFVMVAQQNGAIATTSTLYPGTHSGPGNVYWEDVDPSWVDNSEDRDIYRYVTFIKDAAGNWSNVGGGGYALNTNADRSTNYWLGDFTRDELVSPDGSDGYVNGPDLGYLSGVYFTTVPPTSGWFDIGPENTENGFGKGIPTPDGLVSFSDLVPFSFNFGMTGPNTFNVTRGINRSFRQLDAMPVVDISLTGSGIRAGAEFTVAVSLSGGGDAVKVVEAYLAYNPDVLEFVSAATGEPGVLDGVLFTKASPIGEKSTEVGIVAAACGEIATLTGDATLATVTFLWKNENAGNAEIRISSVDMADGAGTIVSGEGRVLALGAQGVIPTEYALHQNFPNPFNPSTTIAFDLPENVDVRLVIYNLLGQEVKTVIAEAMVAGSYRMQWNGTNNAGHPVGSGLYVYTFQAGSFNAVKKMLLTR